MKWLKLLLVTVILYTLVGCTKEVPIGYIGMVQKRSGLSGEALAPGRHSCWGIGVKMIIIEASENIRTEKMKILCDDDLNFGFDLKIRGQIKDTNGEKVKTLLNNKGSAAIPYKGSEETLVLQYEALYSTYIKPQSRTIAREIVSKYKTTEIRSNRAKIDAAIFKKVKESLKGTPVEINMIASSNYDYPDVITTAMEKKREREIAVQQEAANQALKLLQATNRQKMAQKMIIVRAAEGKAEAAYLRQIAPVISKNYVELRRIETRAPMWEKIAPGDKVIIDARDVIPVIGK
jgi:hypothetical protein